MCSVARLISSGICIYLYISILCSINWKRSVHWYVNRSMWWFKGALRTPTEWLWWSCKIKSVISIVVVVVVARSLVRSLVQCSCVSALSSVLDTKIVRFHTTHCVSVTVIFFILSRTNAASTYWMAWVWTNVEMEFIAFELMRTQIFFFSSRNFSYTHLHFAIHDNSTLQTRIVYMHL